MNIILAIISLFVFGMGALTFMASSEDAAENYDYEPLRMSSIMVVVGAFCFTFFVAGIAKAVGVAILSAVVLFIIHTINFYVCRKNYRFENGKLVREETPTKTTTSDSVISE